MANIAPVLCFVAGAFYFVAGPFKDRAVHQMGKTTKGRIVKPTNPKEGLELAAKVYAKHQADGASSDLHQLEGYDWNTIGPSIAQAQAYHRAAEEFRGKMEEHYRLRDLAYGAIQEITNASATYLKGKYAKTPKTLSNWGYEVHDSEPLKKPKIA